MIARRSLWIGAVRSWLSAATTGRYRIISWSPIDVQHGGDILGQQTDSKGGRCDYRKPSNMASGRDPAGAISWSQTPREHEQFPEVMRLGCFDLQSPCDALIGSEHCPASYMYGNTLQVTILDIP